LKILLFFGVHSGALQPAPRKSALYKSEMGENEKLPAQGGAYWGDHARK
jgi:hypothetical protein